MAYQFIEYQTSDGIGRVRLNRPEKLNALSRELQDELVDCMERADDDPDVRVMTLTAERSAQGTILRLPRRLRPRLRCRRSGTTSALTFTG